MKKKILSICVAAVIAVTAISGASLAYLTDTDKATNTFTVGNVKIDLIEQQRNENGTDLVDFVQDKNLLPIVGSAQGAKDSFGLPTAKNYVDKVVTVKNSGTNDAYIRAYFAIPSALDDGYETFNAGLNVLHFNFGNKVVDGAVISTYGNEWNWKHDGEWNYFETTIDGVAYNVYYADYTKILAAGETTERFVDGVYLDKSFDVKDDGYYAFNKKLELGNLDMNKVQCPVFSVAVQAGGFASAEEAITSAFGANYNPWGGEATNWQ
ncbi:MAG: SipW-dependent-type signal peptide-containing protein [Clostridiales bacterium]|nr:SipW-dependent-type signal peptide-containing protein [Clostridiales bacterium]